MICSMSGYNKTALSWLGLRDALLYFPYVIPLFEQEHVAWIDENHSYARFNNLIKGFLPPDMPEIAVEDLRRLAESLKELSWRVIRQLAEMSPAPNLETASSEFKEALRKDLSAAIREPMISFFVHYKAGIGLPLIVSGAETNKNEKEDIAITIASLKLIDTRSLALDQLIEFRKDPETMEKLRRLRLFAYQNYQGKSKDYIEDDILTRIADYDQAAKKWGFTTVSGAINILMNSALITGGIAGSFLTAYYKAPIEAIVSTMSATGIAIANTAISLGQQKFAQKEFMANNPISYISYAKDKLVGK